MRWADSELLLGQPVRFNLAPSRVPEDHVDIEDCLKDSVGPLSPSEEFTIDKMAEEMAISRSNLQRKLKGLTGMPPNDYIRLIRLKTAGELLREGEYRINEVCFIVGFNNPSYFARCFQKQFGILPKDYVKGGDITHSQKGTTSISP